MIRTSLRLVIATAAALCIAGPGLAQGPSPSGGPVISSPPLPGTTGSVTGAPNFTRNYFGDNPQAERPGGEGPSAVGGARNFTRDGPPRDRRR
jgi:hypothetical protein